MQPRAHRRRRYSELGLVEAVYIDEDGLSLRGSEGRARVTALCHRGGGDYGAAREVSRYNKLVRHVVARAPCIVTAVDVSSDREMKVREK